MENIQKKRQSATGIILKYVVPLVISVGLCWLLFHDFDYRQMLALIRERCNFNWILLGMGITVCAHVFRALRWRMQLRALGIDAPLLYLVISIFGTYAVNLVFPRLGEIWRSGYIAQRQHAQFTTVFGSMICDRLADTLTVLALALLTFIVASGSILSYLSQNGESYAAAGRLLTSPWLWCGVAVVGAALWWLLSRGASGGWAGKLRKALRELWQGFAVVARMPRKGVWLLYTAGIWGCFFAAMLVEFQAFDFTAAVVSRHGLESVLVTFVLSSISMGVPSNGGIGPWQWAVIFALGIYALPAIEAGTFANLVMACTTLLNIALGILTFAIIAAGRSRSGANNKTSIPTKNNEDS